jgi:putative oxidoreductase
MKYSTVAARVILGLIYFVFGLNGFFHFIPINPVLPESATAFMGGLAQSGYFFPFLKATEVIGGLALLIGFYVPLAAIVLMPITLNILLFHLFLTPGIQNLPMPILMLWANVLILWKYRDSLRPLLHPR